MAQYIAPDFHQGLLIMDPRFSTGTLNQGYSNYTQAGPSPDQPTATVRTGYLQPEASGTITTEQNLDIRIQKEGTPVGANSGGRYAKKAATDSSWDGWLNYNKVTDYQTVDLSSTAPYGHEWPDTLSLQDQTLLCVTTHYRNASDLRIEARRRDPVTGAWSALAYIRQVQSPSTRAPAAIVQMPNGRIHCYYFRQVTEDGIDYWTLSFSYSDDSGASWTTGGDQLAGLRKDSASWTPRKFRVIYHQSYITALITYDSTGVTHTLHLVSADLGASFTEVETFDGQYGDPIADSIGRVWIVYTNNAGSAVLKSRKGAPFGRFQDDPLHGSTLVSADVDVTSGAMLSVVLDDSGYLWLFARAKAGGSITKGMIYSYRFDLSELGASYDRWNSDGISGSFHCIDTGDTDFSLQDFDVSLHAGAMFMLTNWAIPSGTTGTQGTLGAVKLGGWSSIDWERQTFGYKTGAPAGSSGHIYFGIEVPGAITGINRTTSGTAVESITANGLRVQTTTGNSKYQWIGSSNGTPNLFQWSMLMETAGATGSAKVGVRGTWGDGVDSSRWELRISSSGFQLYDVRGLAVINTVSSGTVQPVDTTVQTEWLCYHFGEKLRVFYRAAGSTKWITSHETSTLTKAAITDPASMIWGHINTGSTEASVWRWVGACMDDNQHDPALSGIVLPRELQGKETSLISQWIENGYLLRFTGSSGFAGDSFTGGTSFEGSIDNLDPVLTPSGQQAWISESDQVNQVIAWQPEGGMDTRLLSPTIGVYLDCNFQESYFYGYDGSSWILLAIINGSNQIKPTGGATIFPYVLTGNVLEAAPASAQGGQFVGMDEKVSVILTDGVNTAAFDTSQVKAGVWGPDKPALQMLLKDNAAGDLAAGTLGTPYSAEVYAQRTATLIHNVSADYRAFKIQVPAQKTPDGQHIIRRLLIGPYVPFGQVWSWGKQHRIQANRQTYTAESGVRSHRQLGPSRSSVEISWPDGWDMTQVQGEDPTPDWISPNAASLEAFGAVKDATLPAQVIERTHGGTLPVVWIGRSDPASSGSLEATTITSPQLLLYGSVSESAGRQVLVGNENRTELVSVDTLTITEEI